MGEITGISWTDHTFNAWTGCMRISPGCDHCYAADQAKRNTKTFGSWEPGAERKRTSAAYWREPIKWNRNAEKAAKRQRVFCASMADVFDNKAPAEWRDDLWSLIRATPWLQWQLLTKRPQNIAKMLPPDWGHGFHNVWLGTTVENQTEADRRIPHLLAVPATVRFLSCEPLLGPLDLSSIDVDGDTYVTPLTAASAEELTQQWGEPRPGQPRIDWVICGGESGGSARPMHPDWARGLRDQCAAAGVPFYLKQWGEWTPGENVERHTGVVETAHWFGDQWSLDRENLAAEGGHIDYEPDLYRVGKKAAGDFLDGRQHHEFPA